VNQTGKQLNGDPIPEFDIGEIKIKINEFLFMNLPGKPTLDEMEDLALKTLQIFIDYYEKENT